MGKIILESNKDLIATLISATLFLLRCLFLIHYFGQGKVGTVGSFRSSHLAFAR